MLNAGTTPATAVPYTYIAGAHGESTQPAPVDVRILDDDAPGVLILQTGGSTNVTEPSQFVVIGGGFVTSSRHHLRGRRRRDPHLLLRRLRHLVALRGAAARLDLLRAGSRPRQLEQERQPGHPRARRSVPHITVKNAAGNGPQNGATDYYKFEVTHEMLFDGTVLVPVRGTFDIDHGYEFGDQILWLSRLKLYNQAGQLIAQGQGFSDPAVGAAGSTTWLDDFLDYTFTQEGTYYIEVSSWLLTSGLPRGVTYDLHVSLDEHAVAGFIFSPAPVLENESANNTTTHPQSIDDFVNFFKFFDPTIGNTAANGTGFNGNIDFTTPYVRVQGSGDGSFDVYSFTVTNAMLNPPAITTDSPLVGTGLTVIDPGPFYTSATLRLTGAVVTGDVWMLGVNYRNYTASTNASLDSIANSLGSKLPAGFTYSVLTTPGVGTFLTINNPDGFTLKGVPVDGVAQTGSRRRRSRPRRSRARRPRSSPTTSRRSPSRARASR